MAAPNIVNVSTITGKTSGLYLSTQASTIVECTGQSNKVIKVNALYISNVDGTNNADVTVSVLKNGQSAYKIAHTVVVPADAVLDVLSKSIYLEEGDALQLAASSQGALEAVCSYEEIS